MLSGTFLALLALPGARAEERDPIGLSLDLGVASAYVWRGLNVFADSGQRDPNLLLAPSVAWSIGESGVSLGYWGAYQLTGPNRAALVDAGLGAEQDLWVGYDRALSGKLAASFLLTGYLYPLADEAAAGTAFPTYLEPAAGLGWVGPVTASVSVGYFHGLQPTLAGSRNVYLHPALSWGHALGEEVGLTVDAGFGYKLFTQAEVTTNTLDVSLALGLPLTFGAVHVNPALNLAWTNLGGAFADGLVPWGGLNVGAEI
ncbi:MAG: TorF family putative porin [Pseudomonadota bacterium]